MPTDYDPYEHARRLYRENPWLRELVTSAAQELERLAAHRPQEVRPLLQRAQRLRAHLHEGPPAKSEPLYPKS